MWLWKNLYWLCYKTYSELFGLWDGESLYIVFGFNVSKKTYSTNINMLKWKPPIEYYQKLPHYEGVYKPKRNTIDFESAREVLIEKVYKRLSKDVLRGYIRRWNVNFIIKTNIFLKTKRYLFMHSTILKQTKSIVIY